MEAALLNELLMELRQIRELLEAKDEEKSQVTYDITVNNRGVPTEDDIRELLDAVQLRQSLRRGKA